MIKNNINYKDNFISHTKRYDSNTSLFLSKIYKYLSISLVISMLSAIIISVSSKLMFMVNSVQIIFVIMPIAIIYYINKKIALLSPIKTKILFCIFSISMGISLSYVFLLFTGESITHVFLITSCTFICMSYYGKRTKEDLSPLKNLLTVSVISIFITNIVNIFLKSSIIHLLTSIIGTIVFSIFIIYDTNKIKDLSRNYPQINKDNLAIYSSIILYTNFINLFIYILQLFGIRKNTGEV